MNLKKLTAGTLAVFAAAALLAGCGGEKKTEKAPEEKKKIVVGITPGYSEEIMEFVKDEAKKQGLDVELKVFSDYVTPDQALAQKEIDLNSFQHGPFLDAFNKKNGTKLVSIGKTYLAPLKLYSTKIKDIKELKDGDKIAIPNDPSNGGRAILMLSKLGLIKVKDGVKASDLEGASMDESLLGRMEAIILSMTPYERENPNVLNSSRKRRIAAGSGTQVVDINRLLKQFDMMQQLTKQMTRGRLSKMGGGGLGSRMHGFGRKKRLK